MRFFSRRNSLVRLLLLALLFCPAGAFGDEGDFQVGLEAGVYNPYYRHDAASDFKARSRAVFGPRFGYAVTDQLAVDLSFFHGEGQADIAGYNDVALDVDEAILGMSWSILTGALRPQFLLGLGYLQIRVDNAVDDEAAGDFNFGLGLEGTINSFLFASIRVRYHHIFAEEFNSSGANTVFGGLHARF